MTADELVTRNDIAKMQESILKAMEAMLHPAEPYLSFEQAVVYLKMTERSLADRVRAREIPHIKDGERREKVIVQISETEELIKKVQKVVKK